MRILRILPIIALATTVTTPQMASAASTFYGLTTHVSVNNIKVQNPKSRQTLSFLILPKFDRVFSDDGKTTYQMKNIHAGQYVRVIYDQKAFGIRHADSIIVLTKHNRKITKQ